MNPFHLMLGIAWLWAFFMYLGVSWNWRPESRWQKITQAALTATLAVLVSALAIYWVTDGAQP